MNNITDNFDKIQPHPITPECTSEQDVQAGSKKAVELKVTAIIKIVLILVKMSLYNITNRTTLYSIVNSTIGKYCSGSRCHLNGRTVGFHPQNQKLEPLCTA